ncbi:MAG: hypothetical protein IT168_00200 [Bryobacterales bacterium]|nr:hypothetical protein [Bryobacterales bacterium]
MGKTILAIVCVFVARTVMNMLFYGMLAADHFKALQAAHPGIFREVIPAYVITDLIFAAIFVTFLGKVLTTFGGGAGGGVKIGIYVALLGVVLGDVYMYYGVTYMTPGMTATDMAYGLIAHAIQGALGGLILSRR